jgi:16S rRNA (uracil1498-N3)-methyltransferase
MALRRFYVPPESIHHGRAQLPADQAHHLRDVLRIPPGATVEVFDGAGNGYAGEVEFCGTDIFINRLKNLPYQASPIRLILAAALIKPAKFELVLEKATELGVDEILPLETRFSDIRIPANKMADRVNRWDRIVKEASKQCRRFISPQMHSPTNFEEFLAAEKYSESTRVLFYEKSQDQWQPELEKISGSVVLCVGPEGGWEEREIELAQKARCNIVGLGPLILRAETAAIAAIAILQHHIQLNQK